jgi:hypothetical protein
MRNIGVKTTRRPPGPREKAACPVVSDRAGSTPKNSLQFSRELIRTFRAVCPSS